jgi:hypothetical protein
MPLRVSRWAYETLDLPVANSMIGWGRLSLPEIATLARFVGERVIEGEGDDLTFRGMPIHIAKANVQPNDPYPQPRPEDYAALDRAYKENRKEQGWS